MPTFTEQKTLDYNADFLFDLVADVESYPKFLPWVDAVRINERVGDLIFAEVIVRFKAFHGSYISKVELNREEKEISVSLVQGPFKHLYQEWKFTSLGGGKQTIVDFDIDFEFRSKILQLMLNNIFDKAVHELMSSFEKRAYDLQSKNL